MPLTRDTKYTHASFRPARTQLYPKDPGVEVGCLRGSQGSGETAGHRGAAVYPHFSLHPLFARSPFLIAFRWLPVSRQMQKQGGEH